MITRDKKLSTLDVFERSEGRKKVRFDLKSILFDRKKFCFLWFEKRHFISFFMKDRKKFFFFFRVPFLVLQRDGTRSLLHLGLWCRLSSSIHFGWKSFSLGSSSPPLLHPVFPPKVVDDDSTGDAISRGLPSLWKKEKRN